MSDLSTHPPGKVVFLTSESPFPPHGGGKLRDTHLIQLLLEKSERVEILCFARGGAIEADAGVQRGVSFREVRHEGNPLWRRALSPLRPYIVNGYSRAMEAALRDAYEPGAVLWISRLAMAQYMAAARRIGYRVVLDDHNVESTILLERALSSIRYLHQLPNAGQCAYYEARFCEGADAVVATSPIDASRLRKLAPRARVHVIPNSIDHEVYETARRNPEGRTLFFSGTLSYAPNVEGLEWFVAEVLPRLRADLGSELPPIVVAGSRPAPELRSKLEANGIQVHADPSSMVPLISEAAVVFVPIRSGSGTRLKILEAMAAGRAVVSTAKGAEGLNLAPSYDILIADQVDGFASALARLLRDPELRREIGARASKTVLERYDWRVNRALLEEVLRTLQRPPASRGAS